MRSSVLALGIVSAALALPAGVAATVSVPAAEAAGFRHCGRLGAAVVAKRMSCRKARQVMRYALAHHQGNSPKGPPGWSCWRGPAPDAGTYAVSCTRNGGRGHVLLLNS